MSWAPGTCDETESVDDVPALESAVVSRCISRKKSLAAKHDVCRRGNIDWGESGALTSLGGDFLLRPLVALRVSESTRGM